MTNFDEFLSPTGRLLRESAIRQMGTVIASNADMVSFAAGYPDPNAFPWDAIRDVMRELLAQTDGRVLQYGPTRGHRPLLESIGQLLTGRGITASQDELLITSGSQQGLDLVARVLVTPGDVVLVELPAYTGAISAFTNAQARLAGVAQDHDGINLDDLDEVCLRHRRAGRRVKLLYLVPNFQNPSGVLLDRAKRPRLIEWARRRDILIIEDDPYGALYFDDVAGEEDTRPIRSFDDGDRVIYLSSFSKTLAPGFRVGWMVAPTMLADRFETAKQAADLMTGSLDQHLVHELVRRGTLEQIAPALRQHYQHKRDIMESALRTIIGSGLRWSTPGGGFFLWVALPEGTNDLALLSCALERRLVLVVGSAFYVNGAGHNQVRLSFSACAENHIEEGVRRLADAMGGAAAASA
ncbi:MAG: PLP-dependent aminotransferase family protein [Acidobacteria bacterium]|nr:PLP-dependent aminotransferase family protein [Acidobacteriota bacterium]